MNTLPYIIPIWLQINLESTLGKVMDQLASYKPFLISSTSMDMPLSAPASIPFTTGSADMDVCKSLQQEEFEVLESIYPEYISKRHSDSRVLLELQVPIGFAVARPIELFEPVSLEERQKMTLSNFPPLILQVILPPCYPLRCPPTIISITAKNSWLQDTSALRSLMNKLWESGQSVLYLWIEYLQSGDWLRDLEMLSDDNNSLRIPHSNPSVVAPLLSDYDFSLQSAQFSMKSYACGICLEYVKGARCLQLSCDHVFCRSCLEDFWGMCISEGDIDRIGCPDLECVKKGSKASAKEVARVVTVQELQRWKWLEMKQELERDPSILNCPVPTCQNLVPKPGDVDPESGWDRFRQCSKCFCSFCSLCKHAWHGPLSACPLPFTDKLLAEYLATPEHSPERKHIEMRYGKATVMRLLAQHEERKATESWITESTSVCPGCRSHVQKSEGCNHMSCTRCTHHFCYRCGVQLSAQNPYAHFSIRGTYCYQKLFAADDDQNMEEPNLFAEDEEETIPP